MGNGASFAAGSGSLPSFSDRTGPIEKPLLGTSRGKGESEIPSGREPDLIPRIELDLNGSDRPERMPMPRLRRNLPTLLVLWAALAAAWLLPAQALAGPDGEPDGADEALQQGLDLLARSDCGSRTIKSLKQADRLSPNGSYLARLGLARCYSKLGRLGDQIGAAESALEVATTPPERVAAKRLFALGLARRARGERAQKSRRDLEAADTALREAITEAAEHAPPVMLYERAVVLLKLERDQEAVPLLLEYLRRVPDGELSATARDFVERPERARERMLPSLELVTVDGEHISEESLEGKVVVLDFWATWCGPCHASLPTLETLHRLGEESGLLTLVSISSEPTEKVRSFAAANGMSWVLARGAGGHEVEQRLEVTGLPTILLVDPEGRILSRIEGWSPDSGSALVADAKRAIRKARRTPEDRRGGGR